MNMIALLNSFTNWFIPDSMKDADVGTLKRVRMFLISHLCGPFISHPITAYLLLNDPNPSGHVAVLGISITLFWLFPILLKAGVHYTTLSILSVQNLIFAILWGSFHYGGLSSPFLMWMLIVPLLAFFYMGSSTFARVAVSIQIGVSLSLFYLAFLNAGAFPVNIPLSEMNTVGLVSVFSATLYVFFMSSYYASIVDSQSELLKEIERHQSTLDKLTDAKDDAERANGAKSDFLAKMSHELRTPLNAVLGYSEILLEDAELEGRGEEIADLEKISAAGKHLLAMVNDILDISKIEAGKMELFLEEVDFAKFVDEVESTSRPLAAKNSNTFTCVRGNDLGMIRTDATKLRQTIFNLLSNAAKFTNNGQITFEAKRESGAGGDWITLAVTDTGVGISQEQQDALFNNFQQANPSIAAKFGGTGLGLSLSQNLCQIMGGDILVESTKDVGSTFTIRIPARVVEPNSDPADDAISADDDVARLKAAAEEMAQMKAGYAGLSAGKPMPKQRKILVVDDDHAVLELAERILIKEGFSPISTNEPRSTLQIARAIHPSVILIDVLMPDFDGWEVLAALKADAVTKDIPVVMLSVLEARTESLERGADEFMIKPLDRNRLMQTLASIQITHQTNNEEKKAV